MYHETFPGISYSGSEMTCIVDDNGDYYMYMYTLRDDLKLRTMSCSLDITEDAHGGGGALKQVKLPCAGTWVKSGGGGRVFKGGVLAGDYGTLLFGYLIAKALQRF